MTLSQQFLALLTILSVSALPNPCQQQSSVFTPNAEGVHDGYFFQWWSDGQFPATYTNLPSGSYSVEWETGGNFVGGKGWNPGAAREITYTADWKTVNNSNAYLSVYGWTVDPLIEYYIIESYGEYDPASDSNLKSRGFIQHNGSDYNLYESVRVGLPNIPNVPGTQTFKRYWAVRAEKRTTGTIDTEVIFNAWEAIGMPLGKHNVQILATEGYFSEGKAQVSIKSSP